MSAPVTYAYSEENYTSDEAVEKIISGLNNFSSNGVTAATTTDVDSLTILDIKDRTDEPDTGTKVIVDPEILISVTGSGDSDEESSSGATNIFMSVALMLVSLFVMLQVYFKINDLAFAC